MRLALLASVWLTFGWMTATAALAESGPEATQTQIQAGADLSNVVRESVEAAEAKQGSQDSKKKRKRGSPAREKDTEGSEAPNRFEADPIIKSRYQYNGQPLEVDPD